MKNIGVGLVLALTCAGCGERRLLKPEPICHSAACVAKRACDVEIRVKVLASKEVAMLFGRTAGWADGEPIGIYLSIKNSSDVTVLFDARKASAEFLTAQEVAHIVLAPEPLGARGIVRRVYTATALALLDIFVSDTATLAVWGAVGLAGKDPLTDWDVAQYLREVGMVRFSVPSGASRSTLLFTRSKGAPRSIEIPVYAAGSQKTLLTTVAISLVKGSA